MQIPTTRPLSPKLGRPKNSRNCSVRNGANDDTVKAVATAKITFRRFNSKAKSQAGSSAAKTEGESIKAKVKATEVHIGEV